MKKPDFFEITLPCPKKYFKLAVKKYFKQLHTDDVDVRFSQLRNRKVFKYKIVFSEASISHSFSTGKEFLKFKLQFQK